ncbi:MAG TPA: insulinase family protein [Fimbriimonas sp.]|nr:insulinase family protein [Fimbriimonas sp.]
MLSLLACTIALQVPIIQPPRLRTILPNGAIVLVQKEPTVKGLVMQLFVSAQTAPDSPKTSGLRHLMEHFIAKGRTGTLDKRLETNGAFLTAETLRDMIVFTLKLRPADLKLGMSAVADIMQMGEIKPEDIAKETQIIREEQALEQPSSILAAEAWKLAFGDSGIDPEGDPDVIGSATAEQLRLLHRSSFVGPNLVLVVSGNVDLDEATQAAAATLTTVPPAKISPLPLRIGKAGTGSADVSGEARAVTAPNFNSELTSARLAAAFGIASEIPDSFVTYTPSERGGLIIVGETSDSTTLDKRLSKMDPATIFATGRSLARQWVKQQIAPDSDGYLRGMLIAQSSGLRPETMLDNLNRMTVEDFNAAVAEFQGRNAVAVIGHD